MAVKVFILGRPGSGKSTAARRIAKLMQQKGWSPIRISDYDILYKMFQQEKNSLNNDSKIFLPTRYGGFDVVDFSVLDTALKEVQRKALKYIDEYTSCIEKIVLIEFARDNYKEALGLFSPDFLQDAYFLFLDADIDTCIQRVHERIAHPISVDDHFVSDKIIKCYYDKDNMPYMTSNLGVDYFIDEKQVVILDNINSRQHFNDEVNQFVNIILRQASQAQQKTDSLQNALTLSLVHAVPNTSGMSKVEVGQQ